jgi:hypothetical protein
MVKTYDGLHDLEDEDHITVADEEDVRLFWDSDEECMDELYTSGFLPANEAIFLFCFVSIINIVLT